MPRTAHLPPPLRGRVFRADAVVAAGLLTRRQLNGPAWRRLVHGVYADSDVALTHGLQIAAARLVLPGGAVVAGRSAAWLYGARGVATPGDPVEVLVPTARRFGPVAGLRIRMVRELSPAAVTSARVTSRERTAADVARWAGDLEDAVVQLDQLLAAGVPTADRADGAVAWLTGGAGVRQARAAFGLADGRAESPQESRLRLRLVRAGLPPPVPQFEVRHNGRFVARVDLAYPGHQLALEYDGRWHADTGQFAADRQRLNRLLAAGWRVIHVTAADMYAFDGVIAQVRAAL